MMKQQFLYIIIFLLNINHMANAQMRITNIQGIAPQYANRTITLYTQNEPTGLMPKLIGTIDINATGVFSANVLINETSYVFSEFDHWKAFAFIEPGKTYIFELPPFNPLTAAEKRNMFFQRENIPFGLRNLPISDINREIQKFNKTYSIIEDKYFNELFLKNSSQASTNLRNEILEQFSAPAYTFIGKYIYYQLASTHFSLILNNKDLFITMYMNTESMPFNIPTFENLFEKIFKDYFHNEIIVKGNNDLARALTSKKLSILESYFEKSKLWGEPLRRAVILKGIYDASFRKILSTDLLLNLLSQIEYSTWGKNDKELAKTIAKTINYLKVGTVAPDINLTNLDGESKMLSDFYTNNKTTYLLFANASNPISRHHLNKLDEFCIRFSNSINFVVVMPQSDKSKLKLIKEQNWKSQLFFASDNDIDKYKIITFPYAFIINSNGTFKLSPALTPLERPEYQLYLQLKTN